MNKIIIDIISKNIKTLEAGEFQEFCKKYFIIQENLTFERFGATSDGKTRKGTPDYLINKSGQVCLQISIEKTYWDKGEEKPKEDIDKCIKNVNNVQKIILCSSQGLNTANPNAKNNIITYGKNKNIDTVCYSLETFEDIISQNLKHFHSLFQEYFIPNDFNYLKRYYQTKNDYLCMCTKNIELYKQYITFKDNLMIQRCQEEDFYKTITNSQGLIFLTAFSGVGKSSLCIQIANKYISNKQFVLWIKPEVFEKHENYEYWIIEALKEADSELSDVSIDVLNEYFYDDGLLLIVDDINKAQSYNNCLNKLKNISAFIKDRKANINIICPIWTIENDSDKQNSYTKFVLDSYTTEEAKNATQLILSKNNIIFPDFSIEPLLENLNNDPYLIGLLNDLNTGQIQQIKTNTAYQIQNLFIDNIISDIAEQSSNYLDIEYKNALFAFLYEELQKKVKKTNFNEIIDKNIIRPILQNKKICQLDSENNIAFRHDRLKNFLQAQALINNENIPDEILIEPYYADIIGKYMAGIELPVVKIKLVQEHNPIALLEAINYIDFNTHYLSKYIIETFYQIYILKFFNIHTTQDKKNNIYKNIGSYANVIEYYADQALLKINNEKFLEQVKQIYGEELNNIFTDGWLLLDFKYGSLSSGMYYYHKWIRHGELYINNTNFNKIISCIKSKYPRNNINEACRRLIDNCHSEYKKTALVVSSLLEATDINSCIEKLWNESEKDDIVAYCIFALIECFNQNSKILLKDLINYWIKMDDTKTDKNQIHTPRSTIYSILHPAINKLSDNAIEFLISLTEDKAIAPYIAGLLENVDNPKVYSFKVKFYADNSRLLLNITDRGKNLSKETLDTLKNIWINENEEYKYRYKALQLYEKNITKDDINALKKLEALKGIHDNIYIMSCKLRARLEDRTVVDNLCEYMKEKPINLDFTISELQNIWDSKLISFVVESFNSYENKSNGIIPLSEFLIRINPLDAENILLQCLENYKAYDYFWEVVIYIGTPKLIELAQKHFKNSTNRIDLRLSLLHVCLPSDKKKFALNKNIIERIVDFIPNIKLESLEYLIKDLEREAFAKDILNKIRMYIKARNKNKYEFLEKNEEFFMKNLDEIYNNDKNSFGSFWILGLDYNKKYITLSRSEQDILLNTLPKWFDCYNTIKAFNLCAHIIDLLGERKNCKILEQLSDKFIDEDKNFINKILFNITYGVKKENLSQ